MEDPLVGSTSSSQGISTDARSQLVASTSTRTTSTIETATETINCLQQVIHRFSDQHDRITAQDASDFWRSQTTNSASSSNDNGSATGHGNDVANTTSNTTTAATNTTNTKKTLRDIVHRYAPVGLESQFEQLYCLLHPCLVVRERESNAAAFCLGHRGMGKSMLVDRCLQAFQDEIACLVPLPPTVTSSSSTSPSGKKTNIAQKEKCLPMFRVVKVHGILIPGHDVSLVVRDILQQLSQAALQESAADEDWVLQQNQHYQNPLQSPNASMAGSPSTRHQQREDWERRAAKRAKTRKEDRSLRLRMSTFDSNLQLLSETLKLARVDQIPILIVLDEVDAFLGGSWASDNSSHHKHSGHSTLGSQIELVGGRDRQLLLYHLLDRVATQGSNICLVGLTQHLALRSKLEKRIKSRMEGTSKEIFVGPCSSISSLTSILLSHIHGQSNADGQMDNSNSNSNTSTNQQGPLAALHSEITQILAPPTAEEKHNDNNSNSIERNVWETLEREYRMGRNVRWFSRIFTIALSLYRGDWMQYRRRQRRASTALSTENPPMFEASYLLDALVAQGASISSAPSGNGSNKGQDNGNGKRSSGIVLMRGNANQAPLAVDPRIQALLDLSAPQVVLVLAARRILSRDAQWNGETISPPPLSLGRMLQEYRNLRSNQQRCSTHLLWIAFQELLEVNLFRPAGDHCGTGPFQYDHQRNVYSSVSEGEDIPLHLLVDINRELMVALQINVLECSTALREWGRHNNT